MSIAAAVLFLAAAVLLLMEKNEPATPAEIFAMHYELPTTPNVRGGDDAPNWQDALSSFEAKNYSSFIDQVMPLLDNPDFEFQNEGYLFLGLSQLELGKNAEALDAFAKVSRASSSGQDADWYTALTQIKMEDLDNAKEMLAKISNSSSSKQKEAAEILEALMD